MILADKVVVITGASSGIGRATALRLAREKSSIVLASRQENALRDLAMQCERIGGNALAVRTDVTDEAQVAELARRAMERFGRIDAWVNSAAVFMLARFEDAPADEFRRVIETNLFGSIHSARAALPIFRKQQRGTLINMSSILGKVGGPYASAYSASKFAIAGFSESLRGELRDTPGIHVCTLFPATIDTPIFQHAANYTGRAVQAPPPIYPPDDAVSAIIKCLTHPRREMTVGNAGRIIALHTLAPPLTERLVARKFDRDHFQDKPSEPSRGNLFEPQPNLNAVHGGWLALQPNGHTSRNWTIGALLALAASLGVAAYVQNRRRPKTRWQRLARPVRAALS